MKSNTSAQCSGHDLGADDAVGTDSGCGKIQNSGVPTTVDPYAGLATNIPTDTCFGFYPQEPFLFVSTWLGTKALSGNVKICGDLKLTGNVTVNAPSRAVLVIFNGRLDLHGFTLQTSSGSGLTVVFTGSSGGGDIHVPTGSGTLDIAAPTSGPWSGVAIYQAPALTFAVNLSVARNNPTWNITGLVYLPHASVSFSGPANKSTSGLSCFVLVVDNLNVSDTPVSCPKVNAGPRGSICRRVPPLAGVSWSFEGTARRREEQAMLCAWIQTRRALKDLRKDCRGVAAIEFAFLAGFLSLAVVNVSDIGIYLYKRMEVENAALVGTMSALKACDPSHLPATINCSGLTAAVTASIQSTSLGSAVTLSGGAVTEGYYCVNSSNALQYMSSVSSKPADCSAAGMPALQPADYVQVAVTYSYSPLFAGISVAGMFATPITKTAMVRML